MAERPVGHLRFWVCLVLTTCFHVSAWGHLTSSICWNPTQAFRSLATLNPRDFKSAAEAAIFVLHYSIGESVIDPNPLVKHRSSICDYLDEVFHADASLEDAFYAGIAARRLNCNISQRVDVLESMVRRLKTLRTTGEELQSSYFALEILLNIVAEPASSNEEHTLKAVATDVFTQLERRFTPLGVYGSREEPHSLTKMSIQLSDLAWSALTLSAKMIDPPVKTLGSDLVKKFFTYLRGAEMQDVWKTKISQRLRVASRLLGAYLRLCEEFSCSSFDRRDVNKILESIISALNSQATSIDLNTRAELYVIWETVYRLEGEKVTCTSSDDSEESIFQDSSLAAAGVTLAFQDVATNYTPSPPEGPVGWVHWDAARLSTPIVQPSLLLYSAPTNEPLIFIAAQIVDEKTNRLVYPAFVALKLRLISAESIEELPTSVDTTRVLQLREPSVFSTYSLPVPLSDPRFLAVSGRYQMSLLMGDLNMAKGKEIILGEVNIPFSSQVALLTVPTNRHNETVVIAEHEAHWFPSPLIHHTFASKETRPAVWISAAFFLVITVGSSLSVLIPLIRGGANLKNFPAYSGDFRSFAYHVCFQLILWVIFLLLSVYWIRLTLFQLLKCLAPIVLLGAFVGNRVLCDVKEKRVFDHRCE